MSGHKPFETLTGDFTPERRRRIDAKKAELESEAATLEQLRLALGVSQEELARLLDVQQPAISKLERRNDMRLSTLREVIEALGGELMLAAKFPDRTVELAIATE